MSDQNDKPQDDDQPDVQNGDQNGAQSDDQNGAPQDGKTGSAPDAPDLAALSQEGVLTQPEGARAGFVALIGEPNAGKSTLLNRMVGAKVSIVTHKVQTTRARIRGVAIEGASQIVFIDTPGLFRRKSVV